MFFSLTIPSCPFAIFLLGRLSGALFFDALPFLFFGVASRAGCRMCPSGLTCGCLSVFWLQLSPVAVVIGPSACPSFPWLAVTVTIYVNSMVGVGNYLPPWGAMVRIVHAGRPTVREYTRLGHSVLDEENRYIYLQAS